jgi:hypothetical protein
MKKLLFISLFIIFGAEASMGSKVETQPPEHVHQSHSFHNWAKVSESTDSMGKTHCQWYCNGNFIKNQDHYKTTTGYGFCNRPM